MKFILRLDDGTVIQSSPSLVKKYSPQEAYHAGLVDDLHLHRMEYIHTRIENNLDGFLAAHDQVWTLWNKEPKPFMGTTALWKVYK